MRLGKWRVEMRIGKDANFQREMDGFITPR